MVRLQNDDVQDFEKRWDQALQAAGEIPTEMVLEGQYRSKLQDSVQLQTVLALCEQDNIRNNEQPSCSRLKTSERRHVDQTTRTRNFTASLATKARAQNDGKIPSKSSGSRGESFSGTRG